MASPIREHAKAAKAAAEALENAGYQATGVEEHVAVAQAWTDVASLWRDMVGLEIQQNRDQILRALFEAHVEPEQIKALQEVLQTLNQETNQ